jgi:hypothetical protein
VTAATRLPEHLKDDERLILKTEDAKGNEKQLVWRNLQLPLYLAALRAGDGGAVGEIGAGYFLLGATPAAVEVSCWEDFGEDDLASARRCAELVAEKVRAGCFWPPAPRTTYGDYDELAMGRDLARTVAEPDDWKR